MQLPLQIRLHDISPSEAVEGYIRERASKLDLFCDGIISCRVAVKTAARQHRKGKRYSVCIHLAVPGGELVVNRQVGEDLYVAIRDAFETVRRKLKDYTRRQRAAVKKHEVQPHARVSKLFPEAGYGFLETPDGREIYFHCNSVLNGGFDRLAIGQEVRFVEEQGEQGPQASTVSIVGKRHV
jgi:ribosomal subunit interface protein